ncbi:MAG: hypothetical protein GF417_05180 [Candidatus Latescibacteria bacterium]|nr:hypothetical protein [bacterium]MBD3423811.1 hypothetical protein [Candidatus Latescibacterota bacterium]
MAPLNLGIDVGTVSAKWALAGSSERLRAAADLLDMGSRRLVRGKDGREYILSEYRRVQGDPLSVVREIISGLSNLFGENEPGSIVLTGSASAYVAGRLGLPVENEFKAVARGVSRLYPEVVNIFEMGGENSKYIRLSSINGVVGIADYETNGDCAAGTGSFMDQQASRLRFDIESVGDIVLGAERTPRIAGRCSVFAKSDMIHAQQKGYQPDEILKGLCDAVARNFKSNIARGKHVEGRTAFIGGVALNRGVAQAIRNVFELESEDFLVPDESVHFGAIGAALSRMDSDPGIIIRKLKGDEGGKDEAFPSHPQLKRDRVRFLREKTVDFSFSGKNVPVPAYLGIDVGSVSTNLALIDREGTVIRDVYLRTRARPIEVVSEGLEMIREDVGEYVDIRGVGTTGSGRELIGILIGADIIKDEITAHKAGASFIGDLLLGRNVDTIFEIGGQDSKFISIDDGVVVDFTMNEACAAGTGSFLEEQAEKLDIQIKDEFASRAFNSQAPLKMGERCTVYMEQDVTTYMKRGARKDDIIAGLAYSVVQNYLNRVVRGRKIGDTIFFQGGTAYNDSVAAAFSEVLGAEIIVPPYNGVMGAIGAALLAREKVISLDRETRFRGYDISSIDYSLREFECRGCSNYCSIQEFTVEGEKTYWGDKCSDRYRKRAKVARKPVIPDMISLYKEFLDRDPLETLRERTGREVDPGWKGKGERQRAGLPRAMYYYDRGQFWSAYLMAMGFEVVKSMETTRKISHAGMEAVVAEPCFPIQIAHGHAAALLEEGVDFIFMPNILNSETDAPEVNSYVCPWGSTLPYVLQNSHLFCDRRDFIAAPSVHFREGMKFVEKQLWSFARDFGISRKIHREAVEFAYAADRLFQQDLLEAGQNALELLEKNHETGIVLVGRPYNIMDSEANIGVPGKLRDYYGINVIPHLFLSLEGIDISDVTDNMFWNYGRRIIQANRFVDSRENLHLIYITNFKCGPDSYIKSFMGMSAKRPFLTLQFDSHGNDAGIMTRCEAYLDSKGVLRWWAKNRSKKEQSTFQECQTEERKRSRRHSDMSA